MPRTGVSRRSKNSEQKDNLLDNLVRSGEQCRRDVEAEGFGGLEIDRQLKFGRLLDSQVARLGAFQNFVDIRRGYQESSCN